MYGGAFGHSDVGSDQGLDPPKRRREGGLEREGSNFFLMPPVLPACVVCPLPASGGSTSPKDPLSVAVLATVDLLHYSQLPKS